MDGHRVYIYTHVSEIRPKTFKKIKSFELSVKPRSSIDLDEKLKSRR